jgi:hypothetical protein
MNKGRTGASFRILFLFILSLCCFHNAHAEYRVFRLKITRTPAPPPTPLDSTTPPPSDVPSDAASSTDSNNPRTPQSTFRLIESTLDPHQYPGYYPLTPDESLEMITTWRCFGRTDSGRAFCPNPKEKAATPEDNPPATATNP